MHFLKERFAVAKQTQDLESLSDILNAFASYEFASSEESESIVDLLITDLNEKMHYQVALTLSCISNAKGLLHALEIVNSSVWEREDKNFGLNHFHHRGGYACLLQGLIIFMIVAVQ